MKLSTESVSEQKKKRHYDNTKRAAAAEHAKKMRCKTANQSRLPRNSEEAKAMLWYLCVLNLLFFFGVCLKFYVWGYCDISKERLQKLMEKGCKCASGDCYKKLDVKEIKDFLDIPERNENKTPSFTCHVRIVLHIVGIQNVQNTISWEPSFGDNALKVYSECRHTEWTR
jgi:hypothetical protein